MSARVEKLSGRFAEQMAALHEDAFHSSWSKDDFTEAVDKEYDDVLGVVAGDKLEGFVLVRTQSDQAEILTIVVAETRQGHGLGSIILQAGEQAARDRGADIMFLEVARDNPAAISFYRRAGYQQCGTRKSYYRRQKGRVDALLYQKKLS